MDEASSQSWRNEEWLLQCVPREAIIALDALHAAIENQTSGEELHQVPALTIANLLIDSNQQVEISVGELLATPMKPREIGVFILAAHGVMQMDTLELLVHRYPLYETIEYYCGKNKK